MEFEIMNRIANAVDNLDLWEPHQSKQFAGEEPPMRFLHAQYLRLHDYQRIFTPNWPSRGLLVCPDSGLVTVPNVLSSGLASTPQNHVG